jgi:hypothetical protein
MIASDIHEERIVLSTRIAIHEKNELTLYTLAFIGKRELAWQVKL